MRAAPSDRIGDSGTLHVTEAPTKNAGRLAHTLVARPVAAGPGPIGEYLPLRARINPSSRHKSFPGSIVEATLERQEAQRSIAATGVDASFLAPIGPKLEWLQKQPG
jgi:hypothetical protein